jgi:hypothetical protein
MFALVEWYVDGTPPTKKKKSCKQNCDLSIRHNELPLPFVQPADPLESPRYGLVVTDCINGGLWVQEDFEQKGKFWVISCDEHDS